MEEKTKLAFVAHLKRLGDIKIQNKRVYLQGKNYQRFMSNIKATEISVNYNLPDNWSNESAYSFDHLSDLVLQLHNSAYTAAVKAVNRFATVRNYVIGFT